MNFGDDQNKLIPFPLEQSGEVAELEDYLISQLSSPEKGVLSFAQPFLTRRPNNPIIHLLVIIAALLDEEPRQAQRFLDRLTGKYNLPPEARAIISAMIQTKSDNVNMAMGHLTRIGSQGISLGLDMLPLPEAILRWIRGELRQLLYVHHRQTIDRNEQEATRKREEAKRASAEKRKREAEQASIARIEATRAAEAQAEQESAAREEMPRYQIQIPLSIDWASGLAADLARGLALRDEPEIRQSQLDFRLKSQGVQLGLLQGFDDLLCLATLQGVDTYWYQIEAVRKVLKQFRGRVLLADEVGLGKTIEAGMALKEYLLRGMVERFLILTPASLVGQWQEEMAAKFGIECDHSYDPLLRSDPEAFWSRPRVIASIALARRQEHLAILERQQYDIVIVDEAHHLRNRQTANWKLVDSLQKRFLLLLSATPVQNSLVELFNLLTLLKPGLFKTEKEFRSRYMTSGKPRQPANRDQMRDLMREVMIRNTRSLVDVRLPQRHARTLLVDPLPEEGACYVELSRLIAEQHTTARAPMRMALRHLLAAAGSTAMTGVAAINRFLEERRGLGEWTALASRYAAIGLCRKESTLLELLGRNRAEKKMVFVHHRETLARLSTLLQRESFPHAVFEGSLTGPQKDAVIASFAGEIPLLLCTESGGEGRNLQFCNTLINFDLPWNPMTIEQRIGRLHRIGQTRDVFIFNLATRGTLEEQILRILDEKINMFELVVGEIDSILGEVGDEQDFTDLVFEAWVGTAAAERQSVFDSLGERMIEAKARYDSTKALDEELFGDEFVAS